MKIRRFVRTLTFAALLLTAGSAFSAAILQSVIGDVKAGASASAARNDQRLDINSFVVTGPGGRAVVRFDDGQIVALYENSEFRIIEYVFVKDEPAKDRSRFELIKGAMRSVSGLIGKRNPGAVSVRTPQATMGIRGTDFKLAIVNPLYFSVREGALLVTNSAGTATFVAGSVGTVAADGTFAVSIPLSALPSSVFPVFAELDALSLIVDFNAADLAAVPGGAPVGGLTLAIPGLAAVIVGIGLALQNRGDGSLVGVTATGTQ